MELNETLDSVVKMQYFKIIAKTSNSLDIFKINNQIVFTSSDSIYTFDYDKKTVLPFLLLNSTLKDYKKATQIIPDLSS